MIIWDRWDLDHTAKHGIASMQVEESLADPNRCKANVHGKGSEKRAFIGKTENGDYVFVGSCIA